MDPYQVNGSVRPEELTYSDGPQVAHIPDLTTNLSPVSPTYFDDSLGAEAPMFYHIGNGWESYQFPPINPQFPYPQFPLVSPNLSYPQPTESPTFLLPQSPPLPVPQYDYPPMTNEAPVYTPQDITSTSHTSDGIWKSKWKTELETKNELQLKAPLSKLVKQVPHVVDINVHAYVSRGIDIRQKERTGRYIKKPAKPFWLYYLAYKNRAKELERLGIIKLPKSKNLRGTWNKAFAPCWALEPKAVQERFREYSEIDRRETNVAFPELTDKRDKRDKTDNSYPQGTTEIQWTPIQW